MYKSYTPFILDFIQAKGKSKLILPNYSVPFPGEVGSVQRWLLFLKKLLILNAF
jgi:hypothetical protein